MTKKAEMATMISMPMLAINQARAQRAASKKDKTPEIFLEGDPFLTVSKWWRIGNIACSVDAEHPEVGVIQVAAASQPNYQQRLLVSMEFDTEHRLSAAITSRLGGRHPDPMAVRVLTAPNEYMISCVDYGVVTDDDALLAVHLQSLAETSFESMTFTDLKIKAFTVVLSHVALRAARDSAAIPAAQ